MMKLQHLALWCLFSVIQAATIKGRVSFRSGVDPDKLEDILSDVEVSLDYKGRKTSTNFDNLFHLHNIPEGSYLLELYHPHYKFSNYELTVFEDFSGKEKIKAISLDDKTDIQIQGSHSPLVMYCSGKYQYFIPQKKMSLTSLLYNPMVLISLFSFGVMFLLPKLTAGMDPEELKKMQEDQRKAQPNVDPQKMISELFGRKTEDSDSDSD